MSYEYKHFNEVKEDDVSKDTLVALAMIIAVGLVALAVINLFIFYN